MNTRPRAPVSGRVPAALPIDDGGVARWDLYVDSIGGEPERSLTSELDITARSLVAMARHGHFNGWNALRRHVVELYPAASKALLQDVIVRLMVANRSALRR